MDKDKNPLHSPHIQALRQLIKHGYNGDIEDILQDLEETSVDHPEEIKNMNEEWNSILYPSKSISYLMMSTFNYFPQLHKISPEAQSLLLLMVRTQEQASGLVEIPKGIYADVLGWGNKKARHINDYLGELKQAGAILTVYEPPKGSKNKAIYQINQKFSKVGKGFQVAQINTDVCDYVQYSDSVTISTNGQKQEFKCGSIRKVIISDKDKKKSQRCNADPQHESLSDSNNQVHDNMKLNDIQENLFTEQEIDMFEGKYEERAN